MINRTWAAGRAAQRMIDLPEETFLIEDVELLDDGAAVVTVKVRVPAYKIEQETRP